MNRDEREAGEEDDMVENMEEKENTSPELEGGSPRGLSFPYTRPCCSINGRGPTNRE